MSLFQFEVISGIKVKFQQRYVMSHRNRCHTPMNDDRVAVEKIYGCKVFSAASREEFFKWLSDLKANKIPENGCF